MRTLSVLLLLAALPACQEAETDKPIDDPVETDTVPTSETDVADDTDPVDTDPVVADDTDTEPIDTGGEMDFYHVIETVRALPAARGFDIDGDGSIDNALGAVSGPLNNFGLSTYGSTDVLAGTSVLGAGPQGGVVTIGILALQDTDDDVTDNFTGVEEFELFGGLPTGITASAVIAPDGSFSTTLPAGTLTFGPIALTTASPIFVNGTVLPGRVQGTIGSAVSEAEITNLLNLFGLGWAVTLISGLADIDSDNDGTNDALSLAMSFDGPACLVVP